MSQLPQGTLAVRNFLQTTLLKGAMAKAVALMPFLAIPVIGAVFQGILKWAIENLILDPALDEATGVALALKYVVDKREFDNQFLKLKMLAQSNASKEEIEAALVKAESAMEKFIRRGPIT